MTLDRRIMGLLVGVAASAAQPVPAALAQSYALETDDGGFFFEASAGVLALEGREHVFAVSGSQNNLSLLIWQSLSPMVSAGATARFNSGWTLRAEGRVAAPGWGYMEDYDWMGAHFVSFASGDWTHRSQHPNTNLDWFIDGSVSVGQDMVLGPDAKVNLHAGFAYTDVQWAAVGGSYIYSNAGFRDSSGNFANAPAITYRQQLPSAFVGLDAETRHGPFTFEGGLRGGVAFMQKATDWHWMRVPPLRFEDMFYPAFTAGARARAALAMGEHLDIFIEGRVDKMFLARGDTIVYNNNTGVQSSASTDTAGAELLSGSVSAGLRGSF